MKNLQFSNSRIEELSQNFGNLVINSNLLNQNPVSQSPSVSANGNEDPQFEQSQRRPVSIPRSQRVTRAQPPQTVDSILRSFEKEFNDINQELKNKFVFILNNCSNVNLDEKVIEIKKLLTDPNIIKWFSKYIVYQRAPLEPNFHVTYINLAEKLGKPEIFKIMTKETYDLLNKILEADKAAESDKSIIQGTDKNLVKYLGSWLGQLTLARNKPIIMKEFDVKTIVIEAYENQKLDYVLPLVCKILTHGSHAGSVFKPKNAWMNAILSLLTEIAGLSEIKMALKCEIQVLLNNLNISEAEIIPSKIIQTRNLMRRRQEAREANEAIRNGDLTIHELPHYVTIDRRILETVNIPNLKALVAQALDKAIK